MKILTKFLALAVISLYIFNSISIPQSLNVWNIGSKQLAIIGEIHDQGYQLSDDKSMYEQLFIENILKYQENNKNIAILLEVEKEKETIWKQDGIRRQFDSPEELTLESLKASTTQLGIQTKCDLLALLSKGKIGNTSFYASDYRPGNAKILLNFMVKVIQNIAAKNRVATEDLKKSVKNFISSQDLSLINTQLREEQNRNNLPTSYSDFTCQQVLDLFFEIYTFICQKQSTLFEDHQHQFRKRFEIYVENFETITAQKEKQPFWLFILNQSLDFLKETFNLLTYELFTTGCAVDIEKALHENDTVILITGLKHANQLNALLKIDKRFSLNMAFGIQSEIESQVYSCSRIDFTDFLNVLFWPIEAAKLNHNVLHYLAAQEEDNVILIKALLDSGFNPNVKDEEGRTAAMIAKAKGNKAIAAHLESIK